MRIQLEFPEEDVQELKELMREAGLDTYKDLFGYALALLHWSVREVKQGRAIASVDDAEGKYRELAMPVLDRLAARCRRQAQAHGENRAMDPRRTPVGR